MDHYVGILRTDAHLQAAEEALLKACTLDIEDLDDMTVVALLVTHSARMRQESRGGHTRLDHPQTDDPAVHTAVTLFDVLAGPPAGQDPSTDLIRAGGAR